MAEINLPEPENPDVYSFGFDKSLSRNTPNISTPSVYDSSDQTASQTINLGGGFVAGTNNTMYAVDPSKGMWLGAMHFEDAPFRVNMAGEMQATSGVFSGTITATSGNIGGWSVNATSIYTGTEDHSGYTGAAGDMTFYSDGTDASIHAFNWYIDTLGELHARDGDVTGVEISGIPNTTGTDIALLNYTHDLVFSATDADTVAWATGTITMSNGRTFSITGSNTGNMSARTYVYLDTAVSSTALQVTTTASTAMGANKILIAIAENGSGQPTWQVYGGIGGLKIGSAGVNIANNNWTYTGTWSVTDLNTVAWGAGTLKTSDGTSYSISGSNTGNMAAKTYIYFDVGTSSTAFQVTTTATTAIGDGKILIAIAQNGTAEANYMVMNDKQHNIDAANIVAGSITANEIATSTITADRMSVSQLSAIAADLGTITAGTVTGATVRTAASGTRFTMDSTSFQGIDSGGDVVFEIIISGGDAGDVIMGDDATGSYAKWDNSAGTFQVFADNIPTTSQGTFGGDGSDGALSISSGTTTVDLLNSKTYVLNYSSVSITGTGKLAFSNPHDQGSIVVIKCQGNATLTSSSTTMIDLVGMGASGGPGGAAGAAGTSGTISIGMWSPTFNPGSGCSSTVGASGAGGVAAAAADLDVWTTGTGNEYKMHRRAIFLTPGSGGGGGAGAVNNDANTQEGAGAAGGRGGGALYMEVGGALNFTTGSISVSGADGATAGTVTAAVNDSSAAGGGGGGGSSGMALILYNTLTAASGTILAKGGNGGTGGAITGTGANNGDPDSGGGGGGAAGYGGVGAAGGAGANPSSATKANGNGGNSATVAGAGAGGGSGAASDNNGDHAGTGGGGGSPFATSVECFILKNTFFA